MGVSVMAKSRLREKELRRRRHRYWKRKKLRIKQAILEARFRKLEMKRQQVGMAEGVTEGITAATTASAENLPSE